MSSPSVGSSPGACCPLFPEAPTSRPGGCGRSRGRRQLGMLEATLLDTTSFRVSCSAMNVFLFHSGIYRRQVFNHCICQQRVSNFPHKIHAHSSPLSQGLAEDGRGRGSWTQKSVASGRDPRAPAGTWFRFLWGGWGVQAAFARRTGVHLAVGAPPRGAVVGTQAAPLCTPGAPASAGAAAAAERVKRAAGGGGPRAERLRPRSGQGRRGLALQPGGCAPVCTRARRRLRPLRPPRLEAWARSAERLGLRGRGECPVPGPRRPPRGGLGERASRGRGRRGTRRAGLAAPEQPGRSGERGKAPEGPGALAGAREAAEDPPGRSRGRRKSRKTPPRALDGAREDAGEPAGRSHRCAEATAPPPALAQVRGKRAARMRAGDPRPGLGVPARVGAGVAGASQSGEVGEGPEDGRRGPNAPGGAGSGKPEWRGGGCRAGGGGGGGGGGPPRRRCGQRAGGGLGPGGAGVGVGGRSARTAPGRGCRGWGSAAAPRPEDDEPPRCPRGDRGGNRRSGRGVGRRGHVCCWHGRGPRVLGGWPGPARCASEARGSRGRRRRERGPSGTGTGTGTRGDGTHVHGALPVLLVRPLCALWPPLRTPSRPGFAGLRRGPWGRGAYPGTEPGRRAPPLVASANVPDITMGRHHDGAAGAGCERPAHPRRRPEHVWREFRCQPRCPPRGHPHVLATPASCTARAVLAGRVPSSGGTASITLNQGSFK